MTTLVRARIAHTPDGLEAFDDGALAFADGRILAVGEHRTVAGAHPDAETIDARDAILLPGLVDTHVHFPQVSIIGAMGLELLDWLTLRTLPEEARMADPDHARATARAFVAALARNGTTTALVFGSHFPVAQEALFAEAERCGLRIASGLVFSDRSLRPELEVTGPQALADGHEMIERWHGRGRLRYAVEPRFSVSCGDDMLAACAELLDAAPGLLFTTHLNENRAEIARVRELFPTARDYLDTYERHGLVRESSVFAHDVHVTDDELRRLAGARACVAHCPSSNAFLGSGTFPLRRHLEAGVRLALGSDVGAGTGLSLFKEALMAYHVQMVREDGKRLAPADLLHLATRAGALALGLGEETGDLQPGRSADFVLLRAPAGSTLAAVLEAAPDWDARLGAVFTLAREECVREVRVAGEPVYVRPS
jgi:guanine deaminase